MRYEIHVELDDSCLDVVTSKTYHEFLDKYNALGVGHDRTQTSTIFLSSEKPLDLEELARDLEGIPILSIEAD